LGTIKFIESAKQIQDSSGTGSGRFLGKDRTALWAVPFEMAIASQVSDQDLPSSRSVAILERYTTTRGLPNRFPRYFARAIPEQTLSLTF